MGGNNITNLKSGGDEQQSITNGANIGDVRRISKANDLHIAQLNLMVPRWETFASYAYDAADKSVTLKYNDGNVLIKLYNRENRLIWFS